MKILLLNRKTDLDKIILREFISAGESVENYLFGNEVDTRNFVVFSETERRNLALKLQKRDYDIVFSLSYIHEVSVFCQMLGVLYVCWVLDFPNADLFRNSIKSECNCFFINSASWTEILRKNGCENVFYLPAAFDGKDIDGKDIQDKDIDVLYFNSLKPASSDSPFNRNISLSDACRGFMDGLVHSQRVLYDDDVITSGLKDEFVSEILSYCDFDVFADLWVNQNEILRQKYFIPQVMLQERLLFCQRFQERLMLVSRGDALSLLDAKEVSEYISDADERSKIIRRAKINLCLPNRYANGGMTRHMFEVMGNGGLMITPINHELEELFKKGIDYIEVDSIYQYIRKVNHFLDNPEEMEEIAGEISEIIRQEHKYSDRINLMLNILNG